MTQPRDTWVRQAHVQSIWGPQPDREELIRQGVRPVPVAETTATQALVSQGIDPK